ncbi:CAP domain-containing protein [Georgenia sp. MJ206]|uniref:CAP domain-containing protein n=1 Tax=Georgenia wangjunii TaxID=3117730 RepID=UPI002F2610F1
MLTKAPAESAGAFVVIPIIAAIRKARHMRAWRHVVLVSAGLFLAACTAAQEARDEPSSRGIEASSAAEPDIGVYANELVARTNAVRVAEGLDPLVESSCAESAALQRAARLAGDDELEHAPLGPVIEACAPMTTAAENLVNSAATPVEVVQAWLASPGHRANIVDPVLTEIGIGCVKDDAHMLCSQVFLGP